MYYVFKQANLLSDNQNRLKGRKNVTSGYLRTFLDSRNHAKELAIKIVFLTNKQGKKKR